MTFWTIKKPNFGYYPDPSLIMLSLINQFAQPDMLDDHGFWKTSGATGVYVQEIVGRTYGLGYWSWLRVGVRLQFYGLVQVDTLLHHAADGERRAAGAGNFAPRTGVKKLEGRRRRRMFSGMDKFFLNFTHSWRKKRTKLFKEYIIKSTSQEERRRYSYY